jgi:hypothetical protein
MNPLARRTSVAAGIVALAFTTASANGDPGTQSTLTATAGRGAGLVEVSPTAHDVVGPDTFNVEGTVNVHDTTPNTAFTVLRRVDLNPDGACTSAAWLTLPPPNQQTLTTSSEGAGALHFEISRGAPILDGTRFDVQWRLTGSDGTVLESNCITVTVK